MDKVALIHFKVRCQSIIEAAAGLKLFTNQRLCPLIVFILARLIVFRHLNLDLCSGSLNFYLMKTC